MDKLAQYYEKAVAFSENGNIYRPFSLFERLSHERRMALLANLPLPDLSRATVVDYGVGSWGFGCIFPKLKSCERAIGIDISKTAVALSKKGSESDSELAGKDVRFYTSSGYDLPLADSSVDLFFSGECIEHIEDTDSFLSEVHRVLRLDGIAIFTTPNATPYVYRQVGYKWCMSFEHVALMTEEDFIGFLNKYFTVEIKKGFNQSLHPDIDLQIDEDTAKAWVNACENDLNNASGMIALVRKTTERTFRKAQINVVEFDKAIASIGYRDLTLVNGVFGRMIASKAMLEIEVPLRSERCNLIFWSHAWSGIAKITTGDIDRTVDLYSHVGGCWRVQINVNGCDLITIESLTKKRSESKGYEVIFVRAVFVASVEE